MNGIPYVAGSETSQAAAEEIEAGAPGLRKKVFTLLREKGPLTDEQMQALLGMNPSTQRPRRIELVKVGLVNDSGLKAKTSSGRSAVLWRAR